MSSHAFKTYLIFILFFRVWICNKAAKTFAHADAVQYRGAFALRQRMLNCVQNLEYHMMVEVIEPYWQSFRDKINKVSSIRPGGSIREQLGFCESIFRSVGFFCFRLDFSETW